MPQSRRVARIITTAAFIPAILFAVSSQSVAAGEYLAQAAPMTAAPGATPKPRTASVDRIENQIVSLHKQFQIKPDQEVLWDTMAQVMRENGRKMRESVTERTAKLKTMNAVDDLKSYQMITDAHSDGLKRLVPAFEALYAKMSPTQQKHADHVFDARQRQAAIRG